MTGRFTKSIATVSTIAAVSLLSAPWGVDAKVRGPGEKFEQRAQTTIGGSEYFVQGRITSIDGNQYWVMQPSGAEIRLEVSNSTNMLCPTRQGDQKAEMESAKTSGFRIGDCPFRIGEWIKAETTDIGTVTFIRPLKQQAPEDVAAEAGLPGKYTWLPVPLGGLSVSGAEQRTVETSDGHTLGYLKRVIVDSQKGTTEYGVVELASNGRLVALPWEAFNKVHDDKTVLRIDPTKKQMVDIPTFSYEGLSMVKIQNYWEGHATHPEKAAVETYAAPWVENVVREFDRRSSFQQAMQNDPYMPQTLFRYLNDAAEDLQQGKQFEAVEHFRRALLKLDEGVENHILPKSAVEKIKSAVILHAPQQLVAALEPPKQRKRSIKMAEAIDIATDHYPGEVIDAEYLGKYGKPAYRVAIMAGTGVTHAIQVDAQTGEVLKDVPEPGHPMPNEPFR